MDVAFTASQKAVGVPPGLALMAAGPRALAELKSRKTPVGSYYADWNNWLPVMEAYEARKTAYFGTPAVNLVFALNVSLGQILAEGMGARVNRHLALSRACKAGLSAMGLGQVPLQPEFAAHTLSAPRYPQGIEPARFLGAVGKAGVMLAGGLHPAVKNEYFRIGHMGANNRSDVVATVAAIEAALKSLGYQPPASGVEAALSAY